MHVQIMHNNYVHNAGQLDRELEHYLQLNDKVCIIKNRFVGVFELPSGETFSLWRDVPS